MLPPRLRRTYHLTLTTLGTVAAVLAASLCSAQSVYHNGFEPTAASTCVEKSIRRVGGDRLGFAFPTANGAVPGSSVDSTCIRLTGIESSVNFTANRGALVSVNGGPFQSPPVSLVENDEVRLRLTAPTIADAEETSFVQIDGEFLADFTVRAANQARAPQVFEVGPGKPFRELGEIANQLVAGDVVELSRDAVYQPVEFRRAGLPHAPITLRAAEGGIARPLIQGGSTTVSLRGAHHYRLQGIEITGGSQICLRHEANDTWLERSHVYGCERHGILGADLYTGSLKITATEVNDVGGQPPGENLKHPIYVATDRDRYPGSVLRVERSHIHDFGGNGIKSRAERAEIHQNWIIASSRGIYSIELNGYEEYLTEPGLTADVFGNVLEHHHVFGLRMGGDGTGAHRGRVRIAHNTILQGSGFTQFTPVLRFFHELEAVSVRNNVFARFADSAANLPLRLVRDDATWTQGARLLDGESNWVPNGSDSIAAGYLPAEWNGTTFGTTPGYADLDPQGVSLSMLFPAEIVGIPVAPAATGAFDIGNPLQQPEFGIPRARPQPGNLIPQWAGPPQTPILIGVH
ncbi:hypothetical protein [Pseudomarimonas arenosa]|uniref:Right handed beta helix domain-containing protein n=1 Tax=Pseudomarimonas arenosa TaxID=2774145 RepID=A0AAW3ZI50_9GAMM|nr:hypothetical protein [Pseudomarimonas arenosa]MBD8525673.1 hypothetical protein [Pseudomarimonas arenosa]